MKDDLTSYVWLIAVANADAVTTADCLLRWFSSFGTVTTWVSDQGSHFLNETVAEIKDRTKAQHHFTLPYCPWSNGTVEVVCRELKKITRALLNEFKLATTMWKSTLPLVQGALNNAILKRLGDKCPMTLFTGQLQDTPVTAIVTRDGKSTKVHNIEESRLNAIMRASELHADIDRMHRQVANSTTLRRNQATTSYNQRTGVRPVNFAKGDFVLKGRAKLGKKLQLTWTGPFRVTECRSEYLFEVEDLVTKERTVAHGRRLKHFRNADYEVTEDLLQHLDYQRGELLVIESFDDIREKNGQIECLVKWKGFEESENDWLTAELLQEDVPDLYREYLKDLAKSGTTRQREIANRLL